VSRVPIVIYIEPKDDAECGTCPQNVDPPPEALGSARWCRLFQQHTPTNYGKRSRVSACIAAEERAHASGLLGEEASRALMEILESPPEPAEALKALHADLKDEAKHGRAESSHKRSMECGCGGDVRRDEAHAAYYCVASGVWLERKCNDTRCRFCKDRPAKRAIL